MTSLSSAVPWLSALLLLGSVLLVLHRPIGRLLGLLARSSLSLAFLAVLRQLGGLFGITLGVNWTNALVLGMLGVPGFGLLLMLQWLFQS